MPQKSIKIHTGILCHWYKKYEQCTNKSCLYLRYPNLQYLNIHKHLFSQHTYIHYTIWCSYFTSHTPLRFYGIITLLRKWCEIPAWYKWDCKHVTIYTQFNGLPSDGHWQVKRITKILNENEYKHADWTCVYVYKSYMTIWHSLVTSVIISTSLTVMTHNGQQDNFIKKKKCELWVFLYYHLSFSLHKLFHTLKFSLI